MSISATATTSTHTIDLTVVATDTDGPSALTYAWTVATPSASQMTIANGNTATATITFPINGVYNVQVAVGDGAASVTKAVTITVTAPVFSISGTVLDDGQPPNPPVGVELIWDPVNATILTSTTAGPTAATPGAYQFENLIGPETSFKVKVPGSN